jgi:hypothetical protein
MAFNWAFFARKHAHKGLDADGSTPVDFDDLAGDLALSDTRLTGTISLEDSRIADVLGHATARNIAFDCLAGNDTVTYRAGITLKLWDGTRWRTRVLASDVSVNDAADANTKYPYAYYDSATDAILFEHSTTAPTWSSADGFWISGTNRTRRWLGVMMPKASTSVMFAFEVIPLADGRIYMDFTPRNYYGVRLVNGAGISANTTYALAMTSYAYVSGGNVAGWRMLAQGSFASGGGVDLVFTMTNATNGRRTSYQSHSAAGASNATLAVTTEHVTRLTTLYYWSSYACTVTVDLYGVSLML